MLEVLAALLPPLGVGFLFYLVIRAMIHADRRERAALARMEEVEKRGGDTRRRHDAS